MKKALAELFRHSTWANLLLLDECSGLTNEQLDATAVGTYGSVRNTLMHIVSAEQRYVGRLTGKMPEGPLQGDSFLGFEELKRFAQENGEKLEQLAANSSDDRKLQVTFRDGEYSIAEQILLVQAINHSTEHRAQVAAILTQQGIVPPVMDGWAYGYSTGQIRAL